MVSTVKHVATICSRRANVIDESGAEPRLRGNQQRASNTIVPSAAHTAGDARTAPIGVGTCQCEAITYVDSIHRFLFLYSTYKLE